MRNRGLLILLLAALLLGGAVTAWMTGGPVGSGAGARSAEQGAGTERGTDATAAPHGRRPARAAAQGTAQGADADPDELLPPTPEETRPHEDELRDQPVTLRVVAADDGRPVAGALVRVYPGWKPEAFAEGRTGTDGAVALTGRAPELSSLEAFVRAEGFVAHHSDFERDADREVRLLRGAPLAGRVVLADTGAPVAGAEVFAWDVETREEADFDPLRRGDPDSGGMTTDAEGRFRLSGLPPRHTVLVAARADGVGIVQRRVEPGAAPAELVLRLGEGGTVEGRVTRDDGGPAAGAVVWAAEPGEDHQLTFPDSRWMEDRGDVRLLPFATAGSDGTYRLRGLPAPGRYVPVASGPDGARGVADLVEVRAPGDGVARDLALVTPARISATCFGPDGAGVGVGRYDLFHPDGSEIRDPRFCWAGWSSGSEFGMSCFAPGAYVLVVRPDGPWRTARVPVTLAPGERKKVEVRFEAGARVSGTVVDDTGAPVESVGVSAEGGGFAPWTETDAQGAFVLDGLRDAEQTLTAASRFGLHAPATVRVRPGAEPVRIVLPRLPTVTAVLAPLDGVEDEVLVLVRVSDEERRSWVARDAAGRVRVPFVPEGKAFGFTILPGEGFVPIVRPRVVVEQGATLDLGVLRVHRGFTLEGTVLDGDGSPAADAEVGAWDGSARRTATTDAAGRFRIEHLPEESVRVTVRTTGHATLYASASCDAPLTLRCERGLPVTVVLTSDDATTVLRRDLRLLPVDAAGRADESRPTDASADGRGAASARLLPGTWEVWAFDPGTTFSQGRSVRRRERTVRRLGTIRVAGDAPSQFELRLPPE